MKQERPANAVSRPVSASQALEVRPGGSTVQDDWRAALASALFRGGADNYDVALNLLLPTVRRIVAAELRAAADWAWDRNDGYGSYSPVIDHLNERADELDATPDPGKA